METQSTAIPVHAEIPANPKRKYLFIGLGILGTAALAGLGYWLYKRSTSGSGGSDDGFTQKNEPDFSLPPSYTPPTPPKTTESNFPLQKGSRGKLVKQLQNALITQYGAGILPKYGADGIWGSELTAALTSKGFSAPIDADAFAKITGGSSDSSSNNSNSTTTSNPKEQIANALKEATSNYDFDGALKQVRQIKNITDYVAVNEKFKQLRVRDGVRQTIVNATLTTFIDPKEKQTLTDEFTRIGLKYNGSQWSLSGLSGHSPVLITRKDNTQVWAQIKDSFKIFTVPKNTLLGQLLYSFKGVTAFRARDGRNLFVNSNDIRYA